MESKISLIKKKTECWKLFPECLRSTRLMNRICEILILVIYIFSFYFHLVPLLDLIITILMYYLVVILEGNANAHFTSVGGANALGSCLPTANITQRRRRRLMKRTGESETV